MLHSTRQLGISQRRADWFMKWTSEVAFSRTVHMRSFEEGLDRVMYVAGALEGERTFSVLRRGARMQGGEYHRGQRQRAPQGFERVHQERHVAPSGQIDHRAHPHDRRIAKAESKGGVLKACLRERVPHRSTVKQRQPSRSAARSLE